MPWTYVIDSGATLWPAGNKLTTGYSGSPAGLNDASKMDVPDVGPIPVGTWTIGHPYDDFETTGPFTMPLTPLKETVTFGRTGFKIHGDSVSLAGLERASHGCIILSRFAREAIWSNGDRVLNVVAKIPGG